MCLGGGERQHLTFVMVCVCVCVTGNQISDAGATELGKGLATNCALQNLHLGGKCREDASVGTARGGREGHGVCVSGCVVGVDLYPPDLHLLLV